MTSHLLQTILLLFWLATMVTKKYVIRGLMKMEDDVSVDDDDDGSGCGNGGGGGRDDGGCC